MKYEVLKIAPQIWVLHRRGGPDIPFTYESKIKADEAALLANHAYAQARWDLRKGLEALLYAPIPEPLNVGD